ncbi:hypothetical protein [Antarctobacter sp.]|uniref:hypothetical protein n=1 Tax=Antarctobacter sp. TaxID=1872577 RepID=UPI003A8F4640
MIPHTLNGNPTFFQRWRILLAAIGAPAAQRAWRQRAFFLKLIREFLVTTRKGDRPEKQDPEDPVFFEVDEFSMFQSQWEGAMA